MEKHIKIHGMSCGHCKSAIEKALSSLSGVENVIVSLENGEATIDLSSNVDDELLISTVSEAGYEAVSIL